MPDNGLGEGRGNPPPDDRYEPQGAETTDSGGGEPVPTGKPAPSADLPDDLDDPAGEDYGTAPVSTWDDTEPLADPFDPNWVSDLKPGRQGPEPAKESKSPPGSEPHEERLNGISSFLAQEFGDESDAAGDAPAPAENPPADATDAAQVAAMGEPLPETLMQLDPPTPDKDALSEFDSLFDTDPEIVVDAAASGQSDVPPMAIDPAQPDAGAAASKPADTPAEPARTAGAAAEPEPFFPIPDEVPHVPPEDTEEVRHNTRQRRRRKPPPRKAGVGGTILNVILWTILLSVVAAIGAGALYAKYARDRLYHTGAEQERTVILTVNAGDRLPQIITQLRERQVLGTHMGVDDAYLMKLLAYMNENAHQIKAGVYKLNNNMSLGDIYDKLIQGSQDFKVTIPEGKTVSEVAGIIASRNEAFKADRFIELSKEPAFIQSQQLNVPSLEGYLYPSTYFFGPGMKEEDMLRKMVETFRESVEKKLEGVEKSDNLSFQEHLIMASLIEREARLDDDRPLIASVMFNRLAKDMQLQIDATVHFALNQWNRRLSLDDLKVDSPYNTYRNKGLPPGPICSPRVESILATYQAPKTDYLYYVLKGDGKHVFAKTLEEHAQNKAFFRKAQQEALDAERGPAAGDSASSAADSDKSKAPDADTKKDKNGDKESPGADKKKPKQ